jgi:hypothetical protein
MFSINYLEKSTVSAFAEESVCAEEPFQGQ